MSSPVMTILRLATDMSASEARQARDILNMRLRELKRTQVI